MNIIVLVIDTLRYDAIGANSPHPVQTPNLDRLVGMSRSFDRAFAGSYPTIPHRTDALTGRYGAPFHPWKPLDIEQPTIPWRLGDHGYCTQLIHDTPHLVNGAHGFDYPFHGWTFVRGAEVDRSWVGTDFHLFDHWAFDPLFGPEPEDPVEALLECRVNRGYIPTNRKRKAPEDWNVAQLFLTGREFLQDNQTRENFFLWMDCFDPHEPWDAPPEYVRMYDPRADHDGSIDPRTFGALRNQPDLPPEAADIIRATYWAKVSHLDHWFGHFLDAFHETGLAGNTALILTADHGTNLGLGERPGHRFGKSGPPLLAEAHVPFLVYAPGVEPARSQRLVQPQDLFATVLALAGLAEALPVGIDSRDLLDEAAPARDIALTGASVAQWQRFGATRPLFHAATETWSGAVTADPAHTRLQPIAPGSGVQASAEDVAELHRMACAEIARRGLDPALVSWLERQGGLPFPEAFKTTDARPAPPTWKPYFSHLYDGR
ncbi:MAG: sulfatase [Lentisphaerae bacterium]|nr:sulfatase [Lentisphaerota bacterium]MBT4818134.1 sulfatase [Lentisphaerota bacterium]MBT5612964.1 sulfatase [Lentisphaerota bacterium]MBT7059042.1 sulfatase [Lentisphaerota bacterium]MBT7846429.1 sulfatase [Lentisphaerota bacterium]